MTAVLGCITVERPLDTLHITLACNASEPMPSPRGANTIRIVATGGSFWWSEWGLLNCANGTGMEVEIAGVTMDPEIATGPCVTLPKKKSSSNVTEYRLATAGALLFVCVAAVVLARVVQTRREAASRER